MGIEGIRIVPVPLDNTPLPEELQKFHAVTELLPLMKEAAKLSTPSGMFYRLALVPLSLILFIGYTSSGKPSFLTSQSTQANFAQPAGAQSAPAPAAPEQRATTALRRAEPEKVAINAANANDVDLVEQSDSEKKQLEEEIRAIELRKKELIEKLEKEIRELEVKEQALRREARPGKGANYERTLEEIRRLEETRKQLKRNLDDLKSTEMRAFHYSDVERSARIAAFSTAQAISTPSPAPRFWGAAPQVSTAFSLMVTALILSVLAPALLWFMKWKRLARSATGLLFERELDIETSPSDDDI